MSPAKSRERWTHACARVLCPALMVILFAGSCGAQSTQAQNTTPRTSPHPAASAPPPTGAADEPPTPPVGGLGDETPALIPGQSVGEPPDQTPPQTGNEPNAPLPAVPNFSAPPLAPLSTQPPAPRPSPGEQRGGKANAPPRAEAPSPLNRHLYDFVSAYRAPHVPPLPPGSTARLESLIRDGKLYLSLHDAIALAIENNLDVEVSRYNLLLADTDFARAQGGGNLRGIDYTVEQPPPGVGAASSPLLITATTGNASSTNAAVVDLSEITQIGSRTQQDYSENGAATFSPGPPVPLYDPIFSGEGSYLRRTLRLSLLPSSAGAASKAGAGPLDYVSTGADFEQGFSTGAQLDAYADNSAQVLFAENSQFNPAHAPSTSVTLIQPLLRGRGRSVNLRFLRVAQLDQHISRFLFEQQVMETIYGVSRLYYDLVALGENIQVKKQALAAAEQLLQDDRAAVSRGTLAPIELTRTEALVSSSRLDLIQAQGEYRQEEVILRQQLLRRLSDPAADFASIVPTDHIVVPSAAPALDLPMLMQNALTDRPDLAQAALQVKADEILAAASRNEVRPALNAYVNVQTRGSALVPYEQLGSAGSGQNALPSALFEGGIFLSTIYQGGIQLTLPLRNRIAQADSARDAITLRQAQARTLQLENDIRQQIENAAIALDNAQQAYAAAVDSRGYQEQLLQAEMDKLSVGESTNYLVVQDEAFLAQARSTEVAARSDWMKARISLDLALGDLLQKNNVELDDAVQDRAR